MWRRKGHRSAAAHVAEATGTGLGPAINTLQAARQLGSLPATDEAIRDGRLSETQVKEIAGAAIHQPEAEQELVDAAGKQPLNTLKLRCRRVRAAGQEQGPTYEAIRKGRYLRNWTDNDGAVRVDARMTPDDGARLMAAIKNEAHQLAYQARRAGHEETERALAIDALVSLACGGAGSQPSAGPDALVDATSRPRGRAKPAHSGDVDAGPATTVHVRVDHEALLAGAISSPERSARSPGSDPSPSRWHGAWPSTRSSMSSTKCWT